MSRYFESIAVSRSEFEALKRFPEYEELRDGLEPTGAAVSSLKKLAFRSIRCCEFGAPLGSNPIGWTPSS